MMSLNNYCQAAASSSCSISAASWKGHPIRPRVPYPFQLVEEDFWILCHGHYVFERLLLLMMMMRTVHVKSEGEHSYFWMSFVQRL